MAPRDSSPVLHVVCGPPACGKSVYARDLARREGAVLLDNDIATEPVVQAGMEAAGLSRDDRDSPVYKKIFREPVYEALYRLAHANLEHLPVVMAGPFSSESQNPAWPGALEARFRVPVEIHFVYCAPEIRKQRMEARGETRDRAKLKNWDSYLRTTAEQPPPFPHRWVDTGE